MHLRTLKSRVPFAQGALLPRNSSRNNERYRSSHSNKSFSAALQAVVEAEWVQAPRDRGSDAMHAATASVSSKHRTTSHLAGTRTQSVAPIRPSGVSAHAITPTAARSAARGQDFLDPRLRDILHNHARKSEFFPIITPLKADNWERRIMEAGLEEACGDILNCIRYGFSHGLDRAQAARTTYILDNLKPALEHPEVISTYLEKEQASVFDVKSTFRLVLTFPEDRPQLMILWEGKVRFNNTFSFGARPAPGVFGHLADLLVHLLKFMLIEEILKWVNDFQVFLELGDELGWIWEPTKHTPFSRWFTHISFDWDLDEKTVSLPEAKHVKYLTKLDPWMEGASVMRKATEDIVGTLNHCTYMVPPGRSRLVSLYRLTALFNWTLISRETDHG
ncbi:hypothetical protein DFH08DRAFT_976110 [Mycena albidolilacea]|uniref:Uncharacterized protein n=1 Tax=Mycena albidolilacea TaxID=1033008 RepID=A0AAD6Z3W1_9AGAR|nr:hypothetical protein DFH08DRAFT_976110 [Mycena albidolilacea]